MKLLLLAHLAATLLMTGIAWFAQGVHYPLFRRVGLHEFSRYSHEHAIRTSWLVALPMGVEGATAVFLLVRRPPVLHPAAPWAGMALLLLLWASTFLVQIPLHRRLAREGFTEHRFRALLLTSWLRTVAWTARALLAAGMVAAMMRGG